MCCSSGTLDIEVPTITPSERNTFFATSVQTFDHTRLALPMSAHQKAGTMMNGASSQYQLADTNCAQRAASAEARRAGLGCLRVLGGLVFGELGRHVLAKICQSITAGPDPVAISTKSRKYCNTTWPKTCKHFWDWRDNLHGNLFISMCPST